MQGVFSRLLRRESASNPRSSCKATRPVAKTPANRRGKGGAEADEDPADAGPRSPPPSHQDGRKRQPRKRWRPLPRSRPDYARYRPQRGRAPAATPADRETASSGLPAATRPRPPTVRCGRASRPPPTSPRRPAPKTAAKPAAKPETWPPSRRPQEAAEPVARGTDEGSLRSVIIVDGPRPVLAARLLGAEPPTPSSGPRPPSGRTGTAPADPPPVRRDQPGHDQRLRDAVRDIEIHGGVQQLVHRRAAAAAVVPHRHRLPVAPRQVLRPGPVERRHARRRPASPTSLDENWATRSRSKAERIYAMSSGFESTRPTPS